MLDQIKDFISQVDAYCQAAGISASTYGERAMNDRSFVHQVRSGDRNPSLRTIAKNVKYMTDNPPAPLKEAS